MEINWRKNLMIAWIGCFLTSVSINLVMPFILVYIEQLGAPKDQIELFSGLVIPVTAFTSTVVALIWGNLADRKDQEFMMICAVAGMTLTMGSLASIPNAYWLLTMRLRNGTSLGYIPSVTVIIALQASREKGGWALGTLSIGAIAGNLVGPSTGGVLAQWFGMENVLLIIGALLMITTVLTISLVKENFYPIEKRDLISTKEIFSKMDHLSILIGLFTTTLVLQIGITTISPILVLHIRELSGSTENILFVNGLTVSIAGVSVVFPSPKLGKLEDKIGNQKVLAGGLILLFCCYLLMALATTPLQLGILHFILGFSTGALMPLVNTLISKITPRKGVNRIYSYSQMFSNSGQVLGPMLESTTAHVYNYGAAFIVTSLFVLSNIFLSLFNFRKVLRSRL